MIHWKEFSLLVFGFLLSTLQIRQFRSTTSLSEEMLTPLRFEDSALYLFQLKRFLEGNYSFGDGAILEKADSGYSAGSSFIFSLWGTLGNVFDINLLNTYTIMVFFSSGFLYLATYLFLKDLGLEKISAQLLAILIYVVAFGFEFGRPSPTQQTLWLAILALWLVERLDRNYSLRIIFQINAVLIILLLCNPIYALPVFAFYALSTFILPNNKIEKFMTLLPTTILFIGYKLINFNGLTTDQADQLNRFGVFQSRLPGAFVSSVQLLILAIILRLLYKRFSLKTLILLSNLNLAILVALNSQVLTNTIFEMQSHLGYLARFSILTSMGYLSLYSIKNFVSKSRYKDKKIYLILTKYMIILTIFLISIFTTNFQNSADNNSRFVNLVQRLNQPMYSGKVFLVSQDSMNSDEISYLALNTGIRLYWYPEAVYSAISDRELFERFACTLSRRVNSADVKKYEYFLFAHKYINREQFYSKWNSLLAFVGLKTAWQADRYAGYDNAEAQIARFQNNCRVGRYTKELDFTIDQNLIIRDVSSKEIGN